MPRGSLIRGAGRPSLVVAALLTLSCATALTVDDVEKQLEGAARSVRGLGRDFVLVPIHADSRVAAWTLLAEARGEGATLQGERLSHDLRRGAERRRGVVIGGPFPDLTHAIVLDAFSLLEGRSLAGLTLVYVGDASHAREIRQLAHTHRARFYHRTLR